MSFGSHRKSRPLTPEEMKEWFDKYGQIKGMVQEYEKALATFRELERNEGQFTRVLVTALNGLVDVSEEQTLDELLSIAEKQQKEIREAINKRNSLEANIREIKQKDKDDR